VSSRNLSRIHVVLVEFFYQGGLVIIKSMTQGGVAFSYLPLKLSQVSPPGPDRSHPDRSFLDPPKNPRPGWSHLLDPPKNPGLGWSHLWPTGRPGPGTGTVPGGLTCENFHSCRDLRPVPETRGLRSGVPEKTQVSRVRSQVRGSQRPGPETWT
jgi:hypothetical protein